MHQVGKKDYHYIRMNSQQNIKKEKKKGVGHILCTNITEWKKEERLKVIGRQDINSYRMNLKRGEDSGNWKKKH